MYTCPPGTKTGAFGDQSILSSSKSIASFMGLMAAASNNPYWKWYAEQHGNVSPGGYFGFLAAARGNQTASKSPEELPSSIVFRDTGLAVLNSNLLDGTKNAQIHFKSSPYGTQSHGYNANNAFLLNLNGERALIRSGKRDIYGSPHHQQWMWQTKSDNAILVNGEGQFPHTHKAVGKITHFFTSDKLDVVAGEAGASYRNLDRWCRRILFFKPNVVLIHDVLRAPDPSVYTFLLHAQSPFNINPRGVTWENDTSRIDVHFLAPTALSFTQKDTFDTPPHEWAFTLEEWHFAAETQKPKEAMSFITLLRLDGEEANAILEESEVESVITLNMGDASAKITLAENQFRIEMDEKTEVFTDND